MSPTLQVDSLSAEPPGKPKELLQIVKKKKKKKDTSIKKCIKDLDRYFFKEDMEVDMVKSLNKSLTSLDIV